MTTIERVKALIADACGLPASDIADDAKLEALKLDSLDRLQLIIEIEEHFHIDIPDDDAEKVEMGTPAGIAAYVDTQLNDRPRGLVGAMDVVLTEVDQVVRDARFGGIGILKDGKRIDPADFYAEPVETVDETPAVIAGEYLPPAAAPDYVEMSPGDMLAAVGTDGMLWTDAFMQIACMANPLGRSLRQFPHGDRAELAGTMFGWFCNAIEAGRAAGLAQRDTIDSSGLDGVTFRKKPVTIEAVQFRGMEGSLMTFSQQALPEWLGDALAGPEGHPGSAWPACSVDTCAPCAAPDVLKVGTIDPAIATVHPGDWIIRGTSGEIYPCKPDIFAATYEPVPADDGGEAHEPL